MTNAALVVAGGSGERLGGGVAKPYIALAGRPMIAHSLRVLDRHPRIGPIRVVIRPGNRALYETAAADFDLLAPVEGGPTRQDSVRLGLESLAEHAPTNVLILDAARPLVSPAIMDRVLDSLTESPGAIAAIPLADTLKRESSGKIGQTVERTGLWRAQTPQGFHFDAILQAHRSASAGGGFTDDAAVAEAAGMSVALVHGSGDNFKITGPDDWARAEAILAARTGNVRVGNGFDVHRLGPGAGLTLCGVAIPADRALIGHSDADVALHAITDALLGAAGAGDIGVHFSPSDPAWAGVSSDRFVRHAAELIGERGGAILHLDLTIICEAPKIGPHREAMRERLAEIAGIPARRVSVKATTTEGLGVTGRGEGIAAQAVATIRLPD
jgi:2-C-methyl-D-erythritol 4-phosphate cytidylyltransferase/2-C-methyl-D-erythritol 2,4-cyclodiphosphate synthase